MPLRSLSDPDHLPALDPRFLYERPANGLGPDTHPPRILLLYGSLRERSYSRLAVEEAARILRYFGAETRIFDPHDLPLPDRIGNDDHPAIRELREHSMWSEGQVWCSPERHGQVTGVMKTQIDHLPLNRRFAELQCREHAATARPLDAHVHDPQSIQRGQGISGVR